MTRKEFAAMLACLAMNTAMAVMFVVAMASGGRV